MYFKLQNFKKLNIMYIYIYMYRDLFPYDSKKNFNSSYLYFLLSLLSVLFNLIALYDYYNIRLFCRF